MTAGTNQRKHFAELLLSLRLHGESDPIRKGKNGGFSSPGSQGHEVRAICILWVLLVFAVQPCMAGESYKIRFVHTITNKSVSPVDDVRVAIACPAECPGQRILALRPTCSEAGVERHILNDQYGQAVYQYLVPRIAPGKSMSFGYDLQVRFDELSQVKADSGSGTTPQNIRDAYLVDVGRIYDLSSPSIKALAERFASGYKDPWTRVLAIHRYVSANLKYSQEGSWDGAPVVLARGSGSCSEFSYLFSALCRATGIATRFAAGSRLRKQAPYEDNDGHRWCEAYFPSKGWVPFDPTLDSHHPDRPRYAGTFFQPSLISFHGGGNSDLLGNAYNSTNNRKESLTRKRVFYWTRM